MTIQIHRSTRLTPPHFDEPVDIDNEMVELVQAIWAHGWQTTACCQDTGEAAEGERNHNRRVNEPTGNAGFIDYYRGWAWLKMPRPDALTFLGQVANDERFRERATVRWGKGSWRLHAPVTWTDDGFVTRPFVQIYLPRNQLTELTDTLATPRR